LGASGCNLSIGVGPDRDYFDISQEAQDQLYHLAAVTRHFHLMYIGFWRLAHVRSQLLYAQSSNDRCLDCASGDLGRLSTVYSPHPTVDPSEVSLQN